MSAKCSFVLLVLLGLLSTPVLGQGWFSGPEGVVYDTTQNRYLIANWNAANIVQVMDGDTSYFRTSTAKISGLRIVGDRVYGAGQNQLVAYQLSDGAPVVGIPVSGAQLLNAMAVDTSGYIYASDRNPNRIYRFKLSDNTYTIFKDDDPDLFMPLGLHFDAAENRLIVTARDGDQGTLKAVSLPDGTVSDLLTSNWFYDLSYITVDNQGRYVISCHPQGTILRYQADFSGMPETILSGFSTPVQLFYNLLRDTLVVPDYTASEVTFVSFLDTDGDDREEYRDNCPLVYNPGQEDADLDEIGDACDECTDTDGDGFGDPGFAANLCDTDNCPDSANADQADYDLDGVGDVCDNCPEDYNPGQEDGDGDNIGDVCDGCCLPPTVGDVDQSGGVDITDISVLIDNQFLTLTPLVCETEGDVDFSGVVDVTDVSILIDNQFLTLTPLPACP